VRDDWRKGEALAGGTLRAGSITVELTRTAKVLFPDDNITKGDLVDHYFRAAELMLPLLADRPVAMMRFPDGITTARSTQKIVPGYFPDWIPRARLQKDGATLQHVICDKPATLV
jgi:bifunctional non-homologous end joining protein LigD